MPRLITFGCSKTFGHGLPDCWNAKINKPGLNPSKYAWPQLLAEKLNLTCVNLGRPGSSNREIWWRAVNTKFESTDTVIILWTYLNRSCIIDPQTMLEPRQLAHWGEHRESKIYAKLLGFSNDLDQELVGRQHIELTNYYIAQQNVSKIYNFSAESHNWNHSFDWANVNFLGHADFAWGNHYFDLALDNLHPGTQSHRMMADYMQKQIER